MHRIARQCHDTNRCQGDPTQRAGSAPAAFVGDGVVAVAVDRSLLRVAVAAADEAADGTAVAVGEGTTADFRPVRYLAVAVVGEGSAAGGDGTSRWCLAGLHCRGNYSICP